MGRATTATTVSAAPSRPAGGMLPKVNGLTDHSTVMHARLHVGADDQCRNWATRIGAVNFHAVLTRELRRALSNVISEAW